MRPYDPNNEWRLAEVMANAIKSSTSTKKGEYGYIEGRSVDVEREIDRAIRAVTGLDTRIRIAELLNSNSRTAFIQAVKRFS